MKVRTIITQDAEVDDQNSLKHFLLYANEVELLGIVQTSSKFHWIGVEGAARTEQSNTIDFEEIVVEDGAYDQPYRWTGTAWMQQVADDYEKDYPNLCKHAKGYPTPEYIRSIIKIGNIGYEGEMDAPSEGSELIKKYILDKDERPLYIQVWGGTNTIARALMDIETEFSGKDGWLDLHAVISKKVVITACGEQDPTYRSYIAEKWPNMMFVKTLQMRSYAYPWLEMPEGDSKDTLKADFMKKEILTGKCALTSSYCTWFDGQYYEGEREEAQFGTNKALIDEWFGFKLMGLPKSQPFDFLSEGDSPTFFCLLDWGFRTLEDFSYGGITGRYEKVSDQFNSKGEMLNMWEVTEEEYEARDGSRSMRESMWRYVADIQRDFAARVDWASKDTYEESEHRPTLKIVEGLNIEAKPGEKVTLHAEVKNPDGIDTMVSFRLYPEASASCAKDTQLTWELGKAEVQLPAIANVGDKIHVIVKAEGKGHYKLAYYQQVIINIVTS